MDLEPRFKKGESGAQLVDEKFWARLLTNGGAEAVLAFEDGQRTLVTLGGESGRGNPVLSGAPGVEWLAVGASVCGFPQAGGGGPGDRERMGRLLGGQTEEPRRGRGRPKDTRRSGPVKRAAAAR